MIPTAWGAPKLAEGKKKPVTLVNAVVARKSAVQPSSFFAPNMPTRTMNPEKMPTRLKTTCAAVNEDVDIPKIMTRILSPLFDQAATRANQQYARASLFSVLLRSELIVQSP